MALLDLNDICLTLPILAALDKNLSEYVEIKNLEIDELLFPLSSIYRYAIFGNFCMEYFVTYFIYLNRKRLSN